MAISNYHLDTTSLSPIYVSQKENLVSTIIVCNVGEIDETDEYANSCRLTLYVVPHGQACSVRNMIVRNLTVTAGDTVFFSDEKIVLSNQDSIYAEASQPGLLSITVSTLPV